MTDAEFSDDDLLRLCPVCGGLQTWCDRPSCSTPLLPQGHWDHGPGNDAPDGMPKCMNLGDRNRDPNGEIDNPFTRHPELLYQAAEDK